MCLGCQAQKRCTFSNNLLLFAPQNNSGQSEWQPDPVSDGWYFDVEPFTSFTVGAHKVYQVNNLVSRSSHAYPNLWVAPGSGQAAGRAADFVTGEWWDSDCPSGGRSGLRGRMGRQRADVLLRANVLVHSSTPEPS